MKIKAHIIVQGRVQGVGFRHFSYRHALKFKLTGYVRNLPNAQVESIVEGNKNRIADYIELLKVGPSFADVTHIDIRWSQRTGEFSNFEVRF